MIRPGLERIRKVLSRLGHPEDSFAAVIVAGTNGKGSVAAMVESTLRAAGHRTGLYTSPHLMDLRERVRLDGVPISNARWRRLEARVRRAARGTGLSEFEAQTALAFLAFAEAGVDLAVLEVGLGGRWDATNAHPAPEVTVVTSIGLDHREWLGPTRRHIYREKREVGRAGTVMVQHLPRGFWKESDRWAEETGVPLWTLGRELRVRSSPGGKDGAGRMSVQGPGFQYSNLSVPFRGPHQVQNAALAVAVSAALIARGWKIPEAALRRGIAGARWPGRFDVVDRRGPVVLDGAHNADAARALARAWRTSAWGREKATLLFGCLKDKDAAAMAKHLAPLARRVFVTALPTPRSRTAEELRRLWARRRPTATVNNLNDRREVGAIFGAGPVLVTGSLYLVGEMMKRFSKKTPARKAA